MSSCNDLMKEIKQCLTDKKIVSVEQIVIVGEPLYLSNLESESFHYKINIFRLNNKLFSCDNDQKLRKCLNENNLKIEKEDYLNMLLSEFSYKNIIKLKNNQKIINKISLREGFDPSTFRLTAECSTN